MRFFLTWKGFAANKQLGRLLEKSHWDPEELTRIAKLIKHQAMFHKGGVYESPYSYVEYFRAADFNGEAKNDALESLQCIISNTSPDYAESLLLFMMFNIDSYAP